MDTPETMPSHWTPEYLAEFSGRPVVIVACVYLVLNTVFVVLRFVSRYLQRAGWGWDDPLVLASWMTNTAFFISEIVHVLTYDAGHHVEYFADKPDKLAGYGIIALYVQPILYCLAVVFPRLAILVLYLKIFTGKGLRMACYLIAGLISAVAITDVFTVIFMCNPRAKAWNPTLPGHCINLEAFFVWGTFPNFMFDIVILILPMPSIRRLQTKLRVKIGLVATFAIGSLGLITAILRWSAYFTDDFLQTDETWEINPLEIYIMTEISTYLICACLLTFRTLLHKIAHTEAMSTIYRRLQRSRIYATFSERSSQQRSRSAKDGNKFGTGSSSDLKGLAMHGKMVSHTANSSTAEEFSRGPDLELEPFGANRIHVTRDFTVSSTSRGSP